MTTRRLRSASRALLLIALAGCSNSERDLPELNITQGPEVTPVAGVPLAYTLTLSTSLNAGIVAEVDDRQGHQFTINFLGQARDHELTILGLYPDRDYRMTVTATTLDNISTAASQTLRMPTDPLPDDFPALTLSVAKQNRIEPGFTLLDAARKDGSAAYIIILDEDGEVVWYYQPAAQSETERATSGDLFTLDSGIGLITELAMNGEVTTAFHSAQSANQVGDSIAVDIGEFHDEALRESATGSYFVSVRDASRKVQNFPVDEFDETATANVFVIDEPVIEFAADGRIVNRWNFLSILKKTRIGYDGTDGLPEAADWAHVNGIYFDATDNAIIASLRNQDAVVKISRSNSRLQWILGTPANWEGFEEFLLTPDESPFEWQYHQNAPEVTSADTVLVFDAGNRRASPFTGEPIIMAVDNESRAVEFAVDEANMTVSRAWSWGEAKSGEALFSPLAGDVDRLPRTGNTLITFGGLCTEAGVPSDNVDSCRSSARIIEVDTETDERVWDLAVDDNDPQSTGYLVYRSERLTALYGDPNVFVTSN
jgi:hypothetical protein